MDQLNQSKEAMQESLREVKQELDFFKQSFKEKELELEQSNHLWQQSENKFRILFSESPDGYLIVQDGLIVDCNRSVERMLGGSQTQILGMTPAMISPDYQFNGTLSEELAIEKISEVLEKGNCTFDWVHKRFDQSIFFVQVNASVITHNDRPAIFTAWKDITKRKTAEEAMLKSYRLYAVISQVNQAIVHYQDQNRLFEEVCKIAIDFGKFSLAWIGMVDWATHTVNPTFAQGEKREYLSKIGTISIEDIDEGHGPTGTSVRENRFIVCNDIDNDPYMGHFRSQALNQGFKSSISLPVRLKGKVVATFCLYSSTSGFFTQEEIKLLVEVADDLSFALDAIELDRERKIAEEELRRFRILNDQANYGSSITSMQGEIIYVNPAFAQMHQYESEELIGQSLSIFHNEEQLLRVFEILELLKIHGDISAEEVWHARKDGTVFPTLMNMSVIFDASHTPQFMSATAIDITELKQKEAEIFRSEEDLNYAQEIGNMGSWEHNLITNELFGSKNYYRQLGLEPGKRTVDLFEYFISIVHPEDRKIVDYLQSISYEPNKLEVVEIRIVKPNGEVKWVQNNVVPFFEGGKLVRLKGVNIDITEKKLAELKILDLNTNLEHKIEERTIQLADSNKKLLQEIEERKKIEFEIGQARVEAEQANLAKSEFLSRMSHELRTPMNAILGFAQLLEIGGLKPGQEKSINHILHSGKHLLDLINEVLDITRIEAGRISLSMEPVQLSSIVSEMMGTVQVMANGSNISLLFPQDLSSDLYIKADRQRLKQVLLNLISNAIKYNQPGGKVTILTTLREASDHLSKYIRVSVEDTGIGISAIDQRKLFKPFERIGADQTKIEGSGLGLSVVKKLVEAMGGILGVESAPGCGSTFWFELPNCESQLERAEKSGNLNLTQSSEENITGKILYIEDNHSNVALVEQILSSQRPEIKLVSNVYGKNTYSLAIENNPDLIFLDLNLPDIHGREVLRQLKLEVKTKSIPVVVISADAMPRQIKELLNLGADHYLTKPLNVQELLTLIDSYLS